MRFKIDEQLPSEVAQLLRTSGHDAATVDEEGLSGASDPELAGVCMREGRAIVTLDLGFADIRTYPPSIYPGIVVLRPSRQDKAALLRIVRRLLPSLEDTSAAGQLWIVDEQRIRVRE